MATEGMAAYSKEALAKKATIVFADETGLMMSPIVRRTWAPRSQTPILRQRTRSHRKVSAMGAIAMTPRGRRLRCFFRLKPDGNFNAADCVDFIRQLEKNVRGAIVLVWDRLLAHRSKKVAKYIASRGRRVALKYFPAYAPELNPVEYLWAHLKANVMANFAPAELEELRLHAKASICKIRRSRELVRRIIKRSPLTAVGW